MITGKDKPAMDEQAREVSAILLDKEAVIINTEKPFVFSSGILSPIYCDLRLLCAYPLERERIAKLLADRILETEPEADVVAGVATAGIPWAAWVSSLTGKSMAYVRDQAKGHGRGQQVEGGVQPGNLAVLIEDLTSTAGSAVRAVGGLHDVGASINHSYSIFTYGFPRSTEAYSEVGVELVTLSSVSTLLDLASSEGRITREQESAVRDWLASDPMAS